MTTNTPSVFSPEDLRKSFEQLQADITIVQNELDQALGVWRAILSSEKEEFKKLLADHQRDWDRDESLWQKDREAYMQKMTDLENYFQQQLETTEKNAVRALDELDAAWQGERQRWQQTLSQHSLETRQATELQNASHQQLEQRVAQLMDENTQLIARQAETHQAYSGQQEQWTQKATELEAQVAAWETDKAQWQQSLSDKFHEMQQQYETWSREREEKDQLIRSLQSNVASMEQQLRDSEATQSIQQSNLDTYIQTLETQVTSLQEFILQAVVAPQRRKSDSSTPPGQSAIPQQLWPPPPRASR